MTARGPIGTGIPLDFGPHEHVPVFGGAGGAPTVYNQALSGALSFVGADPVFSMQRSLAAALTFVGVLSRAGSRLLAAVFAPAGSLKRADARVLAGSLSFTGALLHAPARALSGALSFVGASPLFAMTRRLTAGFTPVGVLKRASTRGLAGVLSFVGVAHKTEARRLTAVFTPTGVLITAHAFVQTLAMAALTFIGGSNLYPDPNLYPGPDVYPYGGAILFQLNRRLTAICAPTGSLLTHAAQARVFTAVLAPTVVFAKATTRHFTMSAVLMTTSFSAQRISHTIGQSLFASLTAAGSLHTIVNPGVRYPGGGGWGMPMPDAYFHRYKPTLRRQKSRV